MSPLTRTWLRRIALGLPIVASPLTGCGWSSTDGCDPPRHEIAFDLASAPRSSDGGIDCPTACRDLAVGVDAGGPVTWLASCAESTDDTGRAVLVCDYYQFLCEGRRPSGLIAPAPTSSSTAVGAWLAQAAHLEAASVPAFSELAFELALHGAPRALSTGAQRAAADEVRHARMVSGLAARRGARPPEMRRTRAAPRSLRELAIDNAVEGCAREAYGALSAARQARSSRDGDIARAFDVIARDEARHALLSLAMHQWMSPRISARDRDAAEDARREALEALASELAHEPAPELRNALGVPDAERAIDLVRALV